MKHLKLYMISGSITLRPIHGRGRPICQGYPLVLSVFPSGQMAS